MEFIVKANGMQRRITLSKEVFGTVGIAIVDNDANPSTGYLTQEDALVLARALEIVVKEIRR